MNKLLLIISFVWTGISLLAQDIRPDVVHYDINLEITDFDNKTIGGYTEIVFTGSSTGLQTLEFDLLQLVVDSITYTHITIEQFSYNDSLIIITPSEPITIDDTVAIRVYYHGSPVTDPSGWGGFYFSGQRAFNLGVGFADIPHNYGRVWFPCVDNFTDRASYRCVITVLENHTAVCGGQLIQVSEPENGKRVFEWYLAENIPTYLASVAVGEYTLVEHVYHGIENDIPVQLYVYPNLVNSVPGTFVNIDSIMSLFEHKYGPYRWSRVGYVAVPFSSGAMEHATNIAIPALIINNSTNYEDLIAHELAHHWFGNLNTCTTAEDMWINEGWANYQETVSREFLYGKANAASYRRQYHSEVLRYAHIEDNGFLTLNNIPVDQTYCTTVYEKGASVVHSLRGYLGDEIFFDAVTAMLNHFRFNDLSSYDMRDFLSNHTGIDLSAWFNDWVLSPGFPHYSIDSSIVVSQTSEYEVTVYMKQKLRGRNQFHQHNKVPVSFIDANYNDTTCIVVFDGETGNNTFTIPFYPKMILCDYHEAISDATIDQTLFLKNTNLLTLGRLYIRVKPNDFEADSIMIRITHNWVPPDTLQTNIPGLFLANNRYWLIEGDFHEHTAMRGDFTYSTTESSTINGYLDNEFINNNLDSLVLMYRPDRANDFHIIESTNSTIQKRITTNDLQPGEYALGIFNWNVYSFNRTNATSAFNVYPNPSDGIFAVNFEGEPSGTLQVFDINGHLKYTETIEQSTGTFWDANSFAPGVYLFVFTDATSNKNHYTKAILLK